MKEVELKSKTKQLKKLAKDEVRQVDDYFNMMIELEKILEDCRLNVSLAKNQNGFALSTVGLVDNREMEPNNLVQVIPSEEGSSKFEIIEALTEEKEADSNLKQRKSEKEESPTKSKSPPNFRPFGLLEPRAAKIARQKATQALERICELASIQSTIFSIENQIKSIDDEVIESLGDDYDQFLKISSEKLDEKSLQDEIKNNIWMKSLN
ncbi:hypothetical protein FO519_001606 [Halicephalobus sp. NKZ332]|nr:hypothetical protein FO519_001606 [Halicephalobus sp. NKZ332]